MPSLLHLLRIMLVFEEIHLTFIFEGRPIAADDSVAGDDRLEYATVVVSTVSMFWWQHDVTGLVANEIFIVWWNQE